MDMQNTHIWMMVATIGLELAPAPIGGSARGPNRGSTTRGDRLANELYRGCSGCLGLAVSYRRCGSAPGNREPDPDRLGPVTNTVAAMQGWGRLPLASIFESP